MQLLFMSCSGLNTLSFHVLSASHMLAVPNNSTLQHKNMMVQQKVYCLTPTQVDSW
jgi:hypothetical protein